ncbi:hypothetical protein IQ260_10995 [Leptolyngbya cf. ectocarpi LEGE 11479]|uniref:Uncharacterized protein n=1 Tax=Leptolyngbya cf. ectocarpi LEGE 11479 TaxID=1828722 RepID=A0A928ZT11_LEPEC|nr:hypothetical protein [Leptolyngbya ectocarpi]MBE9067182.1 hypothetical protein [Leptolyngbya cf. ectocarpi LEGE 11479]
MDAQIDEMPVGSLDARYGVHRSQVYNRLEAIKKRRDDLVPHRRGRKSYVSAELLSLLDGMAALIQNGSTTDNAAEKVLGRLSTRPADSLPDSPADIRQVDASALAIAMPEPEKPFSIDDTLHMLRALQELADNDWRLSSDQIAHTLELKALPSGDSFERYGFRFSKAGKNGTQTAWKIEKL